MTSNQRCVIGIVNCEWKSYFPVNAKIRSEKILSDIGCEIMYCIGLFRYLVQYNEWNEATKAWLPSAIMKNGSHLQMPVHARTGYDIGNLISDFDYLEYSEYELHHHRFNVFEMICTPFQLRKGYSWRILRNPQTFHFALSHTSLKSSIQKYPLNKFKYQNHCMFSSNEMTRPQVLDTSIINRNWPISNIKCTFCFHHYTFTLYFPGFYFLYFFVLYTRL